MLTIGRYFWLRADQLSNLGGLAPITDLSNKALGQEASLTLKGLVKEHYTLMGVASSAFPGQGLKGNFEEPLPNWLTAQLAVFVNF